jgi:putative ABC transport system permease protein
MPDFRALVRSVFADRGVNADADVVEELAQHAASAWESACADGVPAQTATDRVRALVALWCRDPLVSRRRRASRATIEPPPASGRAFAGFVQDVQYACRLLRRQPAYAAIATLTIGLGIGATTTLFSIVYGVLLRPLPWPDADRLVRVTETRKGQAGRIRGTITNGSYLAWSDRPATIEALGGYSVVTASMTMRAAGTQRPTRAVIGRLTPSMFEVLKAAPFRGRLFVPDDARIGGGAYPDPRVVILSYGLWQDWYGGRDEAVGATVEVDGVPVTIVGVMPREFAFPDREARAWLPMPVGSVLGDNGVRRIMVFGALAKLKPGFTFAQAAAEATGRARAAPDPGFAAVSMFGSAAPPEILVTLAVQAMTADVRPAITMLLAAVALLLATATANVGSLQLARAAVRRREMAVRAALGAGRARLARQLLVESTLIGAAGGMAGLLLAIALNRLLPSLLPGDFPRVDAIALDRPVLLFSLLVSITASAGCAILPVLHAQRLDLADALAEDGGTAASGAWRSRAGRLRSCVMAGQVAVACVLLVGAALLARSFVALIHADRGYDPLNLLTARVEIGKAYDGPRRAAFADALVERLRTIPGVAQVAAGNTLPFVSLGGTFGFAMPSPTNPGIRQQVQTLTRLVSPTYVQTLRLRLLEGRTLTDADTLTSRPVVVVNRSFAQRYLGPSPLGARVPMPFGEGRPDCDVVGVVDDMRQSSVTDPPAPELFISYRQMPQRLLNSPLIVVLRTAGNPLAHVPTLRAVVRAQDPAAALDSVMTMEDRVMTSLARPRLYAAVLAAFGVSALVVAGVGLFGVLSYAVAQRSREIGIRAALGAQARDITALVLKHAAGVTIAGLAVGFAAWLLLSRVLAAFLYGVTPYDVISFAIVAIALAAMAGIACAVPARRAARVNPILVLKSL